MFTDPASILSFMTGLIILLLGALVLARDIGGKLNQAFFIVCLGFALWIPINNLSNSETFSLAISLFINKLTLMSGGLTVFSILRFVIFLNAQNFKSKATTLQNVLVVGGVASSVAALTPFMVKSISRQGEVYALNFGPLAAVYFIVLLIGVVEIFHQLLRSIIRTRGAERSRGFLIVASLSITISFAILTNVILPSFFNNFSLTNVGPVGSIFFISGLAYAIVKHRLFDIRSYVVRAVAYLLTLLSLALLYIAPAVYIMAVGIMGFPFIPSKFIFGVLFATVIALYFHNLRHWFDQSTRKIFFRDSYDPAVVLAELNRVLVSNIELDSLLHTSSALIEQTFKTEYCVFVLNAERENQQRFMGTAGVALSKDAIAKMKDITFEPGMNVMVSDYLADESYRIKKVLLRNNIAVVTKISRSMGSDSQPMGYVLLGFKKSGNSYNKQDLKTLDAISNVLTIAIQNALRFEEIQNFNITLQQQVADATLKLRKTNAKLVALDESKDDFISMASHQLRTPLTAVKGYVSMVLEEDAGKVSPMQRKMLNQAFMSSQRMVYLIADLLNVSRLKTGKFEIERVTMNLAHLISEEIGQLQEEAASHSQTLTFKKPKDFPDLMLDETKTRQVVMNFIDNALHYTPAGGHIDVQLIDQPQAVELRVVDDGIGVPKGEQHHLFTKFYRAVNARRERPDGTGLGLFMAKKVIIAQGGAVIFASSEGKGSTFGFTIPKNRSTAVPGRS